MHVAGYLQDGSLRRGSINQAIPARGVAAHKTGFVHSHWSRRERGGGKCDDRQEKGSVLRGQLNLSEFPSLRKRRGGGKIAKKIELEGLLSKKKNEESVSEREGIWRAEGKSAGGGRVGQLDAIGVQKRCRVERGRGEGWEVVSGLAAIRE